MADALAVLHWHTNIDGMDIEFVLGSSPLEDQQDRRRIPVTKLLKATTPTSTYSYTTNCSVNFSKRVTSVWLIDFDACSDIAMDMDGVKKASKAFTETEPYCPRPTATDLYGQRLWNEFGKRYIETSKKILPQSKSNLAALFLDEVTRVLNRKPDIGASSSAATQGLTGGSNQRQGGHTYGSLSSDREYASTGLLRGATGGTNNTGTGDRSRGNFAYRGERGRGDSGRFGSYRGGSQGSGWRSEDRGRGGRGSYRNRGGGGGDGGRGRLDIPWR